MIKLSYETKTVTEKIIEEFEVTLVADGKAAKTLESYAM